MPVSIENESPLNGSTSYSLRPFILASVRGDTSNVVLRPSLNVQVSGVSVIEDGVILDDFEGSIEENAFLGVDFSFRPKFDFPIGSWMTVTVTALSTVMSWSFRIEEMSPPYLINVSPQDGSGGNVPFPVIEFDIVDDDHGVSRRRLEASSVNGSLSALVLTVPDIDFRRSTGRLVIVNGVPGFILSVIGPNKVLTDIVGSGSGLAVELYRDFGVDVALDGIRVIKSGHVLPSAIWSTQLTEPSPGVWHVKSSRISSGFLIGKRVSVSVRAPDARVDSFNIGSPSFEFYVGDVTGPAVGSVDPKPGTRGLPVSQAVSQPEFDIVDADSGVPLISIDVEVSGVPAIIAGVAQVGWAGSTVSPIGGGYHVTLVRATDWPGGHETFTVEATDAVGNPIDPPVTFMLHFGAEQESVPATSGGGELIDNNVVGTVAFDLSQTSFARPVERAHTGYAWDGNKYSEGALLDEPPASWFSEAAGPNRSARATFPLSGFFVLTQTGWSILDASGEMWMRCAALTSGTISEWSMGGNTVFFQNTKISDVKGGPLFAFASQSNLTMINFEEDTSRRITNSIMEDGTGAISSRNSNQSGGTQHGNIVCCASSDVESISCMLLSDKHGESWVAVSASNDLIYITAEMSLLSDYISSVFGDGFDGSLKTVSIGLECDSIDDISSFYVVKTDEICPLFSLYRIGGDTRISGIDWLKTFGYLTPSTLFDHSVGSSPPSSIDVRILSLNYIVCAAMDDSVKIISLNKDNGEIESIVQTLSKVDLTLDTVTGGSIVGAAISPSFSKESGYLYASAASPSAGKTVRYRHQPATASLTGQVLTIDTGKASSVAVLDDADLVSSSFVRSSVVIAFSSQQFIMSSLEVE